jgi:hypothetical protein
MTIQDIQFHEWLTEEIEKVKQLDENDPERKTRLDIGKELQDGEIFGKPRVFVSHVFDDPYAEDLFSICKTEFEARGIEAIEGRAGDSYPTEDDIDVGIGQTVRSCQFFLGIISPKNHALSIDDEHQHLSRWLYIEYGMALTHGCIGYHFISVAPVPGDKLPDAITKKNISSFPKDEKGEFTKEIIELAEAILRQWKTRMYVTES